MKKLALRMRGQAVEEPAAPVDLARAVRAKTRTLPGAAPEPPEREELPTPAPEAIVTSASQSTPVVAREIALAPQDDGFGLIEPGDEAATSAAINASEALRRASA